MSLCETDGCLLCAFDFRCIRACSLKFSLWQVNQKISKTAHIKELNAEIDRLKAELFATREKNGVYLPADQFEQREESSKATQAKLEALEAEMEQTTAKHKAQTDKLMQRMTNLQQVMYICLMKGLFLYIL